MADKSKHSVRNGIIATVAGGLILSAVPPLRGFVLDAILWAWAGVKWTWSVLVASYQMPGWVLLLIGLLALIGLAKICQVLAPKTGIEPGYKRYVKDTLKGAKWRWSWHGGSISNLWCFCPTCDAQLIPSEGVDSTYFICERCSPTERHRRDGFPGRVITILRGDRHYAVGIIEREILRRVRTGETGASSN